MPSQCHPAWCTSWARHAPRRHWGVSGGLGLCPSLGWPGSITLGVSSSHPPGHPGPGHQRDLGAQGPNPPAGHRGVEGCWRWRSGRFSPGTLLLGPGRSLPCRDGAHAPPSSPRPPPPAGAHLVNRCWPKHGWSQGQRLRLPPPSTAGSRQLCLLPQAGTTLRGVGRRQAAHLPGTVLSVAPQEPAVTSPACPQPSPSHVPTTLDGSSRPNANPSMGATSRSSSPSPLTFRSSFQTQPHKTSLATVPRRTLMTWLYQNTWRCPTW